MCKAQPPRARGGLQLRLACWKLYLLHAATKPVRAGCSQAAQAVAAEGEDALLMGEFGNIDDAAFTW